MHFCLSAVTFRAPVEEAVPSQLTQTHCRNGFFSVSQSMTNGSHFSNWWVCSLVSCLGSLVKITDVTCSIEAALPHLAIFFLEDYEETPSFDTFSCTPGQCYHRYLLD